MGTLKLAMASQSIVLNLRSRDIIKDLELSDELVAEFGWILPQPPIRR
jgi:hypothetical protein